MSLPVGSRFPAVSVDFPAVLELCSPNLLFNKTVASVHTYSTGAAVNYCNSLTVNQL